LAFPMTPYLGRTLYGEAPALFYLVMALGLWRTALADRWAALTGVFAGAAFGLAILCKAFIVLVLFCALGAWTFDRCTRRRIRWRHILWPALGVMAVFALWWAFQALHARGLPRDTESTVALYKHYLLFGFGGTPRALRWFARQPVTTLTAIGVVVAVARLAFIRRYDPPAVVLLLFAPFLAYWWIFFTTGHIQRYMWYGSAIAGSCAGMVFVWCARGGRAGSHRFLRYAACLIILIPAVGRTVDEARRIYLTDETADDRAVVEYVLALPEDTVVATTYWPMTRMLNLFADRAVPLVRQTGVLGTKYDLIIGHSVADADILAGHEPVVEFGSYVILVADE